MIFRSSRPHELRRTTRTGKRLEEMGFEHTIYMLQPALVPGS